MSVEMSSERVCYVQCNFCNTILAVGVPSGVLSMVVTVRCGHCANLLSVNMGAFIHQSAALNNPLPAFQVQNQHQHHNGSSSKCIRFGQGITTENEQPRMMPPPLRPPEKRQRVPSAYNRFIKEEIQRIKASNPQISHREAFSAAAKNWAHFPHIHFGLKLDGNKQAKTMGHVPDGGGEGTPKSLGFY